MPWHCCCELRPGKILCYHCRSRDVSCTPPVTSALREAGQGVLREEIAALLDGLEIGDRGASGGTVKVIAQ